MQKEKGMFHDIAKGTTAGAGYGAGLGALEGLVEGGVGAAAGAPFYGKSALAKFILQKMLSQGVHRMSQGSMLGGGLGAVGHALKE